MTFDVDSWLGDRAREVQSWLQSWTDCLRSDPHVISSLFSAVSYSLLGGGKRLRPALVMAAAHAVSDERAGCVGRRPDLLRDACCAVELVHTYSLIHDDLPALDDDDLRRGRPTCHLAHDEGMAILAGDALLTDAFGILANGSQCQTGLAKKPASEEPARLRLVGRLAMAAGSLGMVGGQAMDIARTAVGGGLEEVERVHRLKTGALFSFSCAAGGEAVNASSQVVERLARFGEAVGLAFQITDDILDETGSLEHLGKHVGKDRDRDTATVTQAVGLHAAKERADFLVEQALSLLSGMDGDLEPLTSLSARLVRRRG